MQSRRFFELNSVDNLLIPKMSLLKENRIYQNFGIAGYCNPPSTGREAHYIRQHNLKDCLAPPTMTSAQKLGVFFQAPNEFLEQNTQNWPFVIPTENSRTGIFIST